MTHTTLRLLAILGRHHLGKTHLRKTQHMACARQHTISARQHLIEGARHPRLLMGARTCSISRKTVHLRWPSCCCLQGMTPPQHKACTLAQAWHPDEATPNRGAIMSADGPKIMTFSIKGPPLRLHETCARPQDTIKMPNDIERHNQIYAANAGYMNGLWSKKRSVLPSS